jgi:hypothetical protein
MIGHEPGIHGFESLDGSGVAREVPLSKGEQGRIRAVIWFEQRGKSVPQVRLPVDVTGAELPRVKEIKSGAAWEIPVGVCGAESGERGVPKELVVGKQGAGSNKSSRDPTFRVCWLVQAANHFPRLVVDGEKIRIAPGQMGVGDGKGIGQLRT